MLEDIPFFGQSGDKIISKVVTTAIATLFKKTEKLEAKVKAEPVTKLLQGSVDGFDLVGDRLMMYNGLRIEGMELYFQAVSIDFGSIFQGKVQLRQPIKGTMRAVFNEEDLNIGFNTPFIIEQLERLTYEDDSLQVKNIRLTINEDKSLAIQVLIILGEAKEAIDLNLNTHLHLDNRTKIQFVDVTYQETQPVQRLGKALVSHVNNLLDLDKIALEGTRLRVDKVTLKKKQIIFYGIADIYHFPQRRDNN